MPSPISHDVPRGSTLPVAEPSSPPAPGTTVLDWFTHWAKTIPDAPALLTGDRSWSYREVDEESAKLAAAFAEQVQPADIVGVRLDRSPALVISALVLAKCGAVYLPLGAKPPRRREDHILSSANARHLVTPTFPGATGPNLQLGPVAGEHLTLRPISPQTPPDGNSAFYAIPTSGSTGSPKVVLVAGSSLASLVAWFADRLAAGPTDRVSLANNPAFDFHLLDLWLGLASGAALCVPTDEDRSSASAILDWYQRLGVTISNLPTPLGELVLDSDWPTGLDLRWLALGGERLRRRPRAGFPAQVLNVYGPTETTIVSTTQLVPPDPSGKTVVDDPIGVPIGLPVGGCGLTVTRPHGEVAPRGEIGELNITGNGVALGYAQNEPGNDRFFARRDEQGRTTSWYRTGDLVQMRPDGTLEFHGRIDDQFKVDGVRLEPGAIEHALERHPAVQRAAVFTMPTPSGGKQVGAAVVTSPNADVADTELIVFVRDALPLPAVPSVLLRVAEIPTNTNGKTDRRSLSALALRTAAPTVEPGDTPATIIAAYRDITGLELGLQESLADNGINSLTVARLLTAIESRTGIRLRAVEILRADTLGRIATLVENRRR